MTSIIGRRLMDLEQKINEIKVEVASLAIEYYKTSDIPLREDASTTRAGRYKSHDRYHDEVGEQIIAILVASGSYMTAREVAKRLLETTPDLIPPQIIDNHSFILRKINKMIKDGVSISAKRRNSDLVYALDAQP